MTTRTLPPGAQLTQLLTPLEVEIVLSVASGAPVKSEAARLGITEGRYRHRYFKALSILRQAPEVRLSAN